MEQALVRLLTMYSAVSRSLSEWEVTTEIDAWAAKAKATRSDAIRRLIEAGFKRMRP